jgi:hypothetical protein
VAITTKDRHGTFGEKRKADGPPLDKASARYFAVVANQWSRGYRTKREAVDREAEMRLGERTIVRDRRGMTVAVFGDTVWVPLKAEKLKPGALAECDYAWRCWIRPHIGEYRLRDLRPEHLRAMYGMLGARARAQKAHKHASNMLSLAVDWGYVERNVARARDVAPRKTTKEMACWNSTGWAKSPNCSPANWSATSCAMWDRR